MYILPSWFNWTLKTVLTTGNKTRVFWLFEKKKYFDRFLIDETMNLNMFSNLKFRELLPMIGFPTRVFRINLLFSEIKRSFRRPSTRIKREFLERRQRDEYKVHECLLRGTIKKYFMSDVWLLHSNKYFPRVQHNIVLDNFETSTPLNPTGARGRSLFRSFPDLTERCYS